MSLKGGTPDEKPSYGTRLVCQLGGNNPETVGRAAEMVLGIDGSNMSDYDEVSTITS
jgi:hypothetical protein